jgi:hypothetical protein
MTMLRVSAAMRAIFLFRTQLKIPVSQTVQRRICIPG